MKRLIILMLIMTFILTGCWGIRDVETLDMVSMLGLDVGDGGNIRVMIQELAPNVQSKGNNMGSGGGGNQKPFHIYSSTGKTIYDSMQKISNRTALTKLYFAHLRAVIISEKLARTEGIEDVLDFLLRDPEIRRRVWILIAREGEIDKLMGIDFGLGIHTGVIIDEMIKRNELNLLQPVSNINDFVRAVENPGQEPFTAGISTIKKEMVKEAKTGEGAGSEEYDLGISNAAVFREDKMVGWLDEMETTGLQWVTGEIRGGIFTFKYEKNDITMEVQSVKTKIKPIIKENKVQINIDVEVKTRVNESIENIDFSRQEASDKIHYLQNEAIKKAIFAAIKKSKELDTDIFQFGGRIFDQYPKYWLKITDNWDKLYQGLPVEVDVQSIIENTGLSKKSGFYKKTYKEKLK